MYGRKQRYCGGMAKTYSHQGEIVCLKMSGGQFETKYPEQIQKGMVTNMPQLHGIFDSHAHYDDRRFADDRDELLSRMHQGPVAALINVGCDLPSSQKSITLAKQYPFVYAAVGIHPEESVNADGDYIDRLTALAKEQKVVAIGEIGLDYHYEDTVKPVQKRVFEHQLRLAERLGLPVIIHSRDAAKDTIDVLKSANNRGVLHCYSGSAETAKIYLELGYYIGFTGVVTFPNAKKAVEAAKAVPLDRILLETDCPYMAPVPRRGERCTSDLIAHTAAKIAEIKGIPVQEMIDIARENTCRLFRIKLA